MGIQNWILVLLVTLSGVSAQCDEMFNCTFSGCPGTSLTCYCSIQSSVLWWSSINISGAENFDCITIDRNQMMPTNLPENVSAEVIDRTSNGFTSKLVWQSVSTEVNGSEIGCSHSSRICSRDQNLNITLLVTGCQAPNPPRNLSLVVAQDASCENNTRNVTIKWMAPEPGAVQLQVTQYNLSYTADEEDSCYETLPSCMRSYNLTVVAGVQYTITVSALSNGRESQDNPHCNFVASFCNDTTPPTCNGKQTSTAGTPSTTTGNGTETTTAGTPSTPTSNVTETTSTPSADLGSIIGGSIGGSIGALILIISIILIIGLCYYCCKKGKNSVCWKGHYNVGKTEARLPCET